MTHATSAQQLAADLAGTPFADAAADLRLYLQDIASQPIPADAAAAVEAAQRCLADAEGHLHALAEALS